MITVLNGNKFASQRVQEQIPEWIQNLLWNFIETMEVTSKSEVQFFELSSVSNEVQKQRVFHYQQDPSYKKEHIVSASSTLNSKIVVIDSETHSVMLPTFSIPIAKYH